MSGNLLALFASARPPYPSCVSVAFLRHRDRPQFGEGGRSGLPQQLREPEESRSVLWNRLLDCAADRIRLLANEMMAVSNSLLQVLHDVRIQPNERV